MQNIFWYSILTLIFVLILAAMVKNILRVVKIRNRRREFKEINAGKVKKRWGEIKSKVKENDYDSYAFALVEADAFFDEILAKMYTEDMPFAKRLGFLVVKYRDLEPVWYAHKTRNKIAHRTNEVVGLRSLKKALKCYESALKKLGLL